MDNNELNSQENLENNNLNEKNSKKKKIFIALGIIIILIVSGFFLLYNIVLTLSNDDDGFQPYTNTTNQDLTNKTENTNTSSLHSKVDGIMISPDAKPIIYLYPTEQTKIEVKLGYPEKLTCSYPKYENGWTVIANPDGKLKDIETGRTLYSLYWEGEHTESINLDEGFVIKGSDTIKFLEEKLAILGLSDTEAEEFIIYWLPKLQDNKYNYIKFATMEEINKNMPLEFSVQPDSLIRVLMAFKALNEYIEVPEQKLETPKRDGFVAVEWGGTEIK